MLSHFWPGATKENYLAEVAAIHSPGTPRPAGELHHIAGYTDGGILVTAIWDLKESCDRFVQEVLLPAQPVEGGFPNPVEERAAEIFNEISS